jgi:tricorn protease
VIYSIQEDGRRLTRITAGQPPNEVTVVDQAGWWFRRRIAISTISRDGRTLFFRERDGIYSVPLPPPARRSRQRSRSSAAAQAREAGRRRINFNVRVRIDRPAEWAEMFDDGWRTMKYRFYDPKMHGMDWDAARAKYRRSSTSSAIVRSCSTSSTR